MLHPEEFVSALAAEGMRFFSGVPDALLKPLLAYIQDHVSPGQHAICANEGNAIALAAGHHLGTRGIPVVYMQNSGLGNAISSLISLADAKVYAIPMLLLIGWRSEQNVKDEPQHVKQGAITRDMLEMLGIDHVVLSADLFEARLQIAKLREKIARSSKPCALLIREGSFAVYKQKRLAEPISGFSRERAIQCLIEHATRQKDGVVLSAGGKISHEVHETRIGRGEAACDFLNVGSMGHASSIALGVALSKPDKRIYCLDGDGAVLMHMGSLFMIGQSGAKNLIHVVLNNSAHESMDGQPTIAGNIDMRMIALASGYSHCLLAENEIGLDAQLAVLDVLHGPVLLEVKVAQGSRFDLSRPRAAPLENKQAFLKRLHG